MSEDTLLKHNGMCGVRRRIGAERRGGRHSTSPELAKRYT